MDKRAQSLLIGVSFLIIILFLILTWGFLGSKDSSEIKTSCKIGIGNFLCFKWDKNLTGSEAIREGAINNLEELSNNKEKYMSPLPNPQSQFISACFISAPLGCSEYEVTSKGVRVIMLNGVGTSININSISVTNCGETSPDQNQLSAGDTLDTQVNCSQELIQGDKFSGNIIIKYLKSGKTIEETVNGEIVARVTG